MRAFGKMPRPVLVLEALGGIMLVLSYFVFHQLLPFTLPFSVPLTAQLMIFTGIILMLPAAIMMMWRTAKALAPNLFNLTSPGDKHDANH